MSPEIKAVLTASMAAARWLCGDCECCCLPPLLLLLLMHSSVQACEGMLVLRESRPALESDSPLPSFSSSSLFLLLVLQLCSSLITSQVCLL
jgi:hypothetical protein